MASRFDPTAPESAREIECYVFGLLAEEFGEALQLIRQGASIWPQNSAGATPPRSIWCGITSFVDKTLLTSPAMAAEIFNRLLHMEDMGALIHAREAAPKKQKPYKKLLKRR